MKKLASIIAVVALVAIVATLLVACVPTDPAKAEANLKEAGYTAKKTDSDDLLGLGGLAMPDGATSAVAGSKDSEMIFIYYFEDSASAKTFYENSEILNFIKDMIEESKEEVKAQYEAEKISKDEYDEAMEILNSFKIKKFGKVVYAGTKAAIKAAS